MAVHFSVLFLKNGLFKHEFKTHPLKINGSSKCAMIMIASNKPPNPLPTSGTDSHVDSHTK